MLLMKRFCKTSKNPKGFTLVELVVVIAIIGIIASIAVVSLTAVMKSTKKKAAANALEDYWRITSIYFNQVNLGYGSSSPSESQLKTRFPSGVLQKLTTSSPQKTDLTGNGKVWVQFSENSKSTKNKFTIKKIYICMNSEYYYTTTGYSISKW